MTKLPRFKSEKEEKEFWLTHDATDYVDQMKEINRPMIDNRPKKIRTTIYLDLVEHDQIRKTAFYSGISMADFIRSAVKKKLSLELHRP